MEIKRNPFTRRTVVLALAGLYILSLPPSYGLQADPQQTKYEDLVELNYSGEVVSGTGVLDKGGFTVVTVQSGKTRTKVAVSLAVEAQENRTAADFKLFAVDKAGKRHPAKDPNAASAGGLRVAVVTLVSEFEFNTDTIKELVIQQAVKPK